MEFFAMIGLFGTPAAAVAFYFMNQRIKHLEEELKKKNQSRMNQNRLPQKTSHF